jgi:Ring finger domain/PA domain
MYDIISLFISPLPASTSYQIAAQPSSGCEPITNAVHGKIAAVLRGGCDFVLKAQHAEQAGAVGVLIGNHEASLVSMAGDGGGVVSIPTVSITSVTYNIITDPDYDSTVYVELNSVGESPAPPNLWEPIGFDTLAYLLLGATCAFSVVLGAVHCYRRMRVRYDADRRAQQALRLPLVQYQEVAVLEDDDNGDGAGNANANANANGVQGENANSERRRVHNSTCSICLCDFEPSDHIRYLPCRHAFHRECVDEWFARSDECPNCKRSIFGDYENNV